MKRFLMKRKMIIQMAFALLFIFFFTFAPLRFCERCSGAAYAAGSLNSYTIQWGRSEHGRMAVVTWNWVADDTTGRVPGSSLSAADTDALKYFYVDMGETKPGTFIAPTALYDVTLEDPDGMDVFGGKMMNRSNTTGEQVLPAMSGALGSRPLYTGLTLRVYNNSVNSATGKVIITFIK